MSSKAGNAKDKKKDRPRSTGTYLYFGDKVSVDLYYRSWIKFGLHLKGGVIPKNFLGYKKYLVDASKKILGYKKFLVVASKKFLEIRNSWRIQENSWI